MTHDNRGGKRQGAGRKSLPGEARKVNVRLLAEQWHQIEQLAEQSNVSSMVSKLVSQALQQRKGSE